MIGFAEQPAWPRGESPVPVRRSPIVSRSRLPDKADRNAALTRTSKPKGEGRHVITDALGLLLGAGVGPASDTGGQCLPDLLQRLLGKVPRLKVIFADGCCGGVPNSLMWRCFHWTLSIVEREDSQTGFKPLPKRWVVERTFGWFGAYRRLNQDYEYRPETAEAMIRLGMSRLMLRRIT